MSEFQIWKKNRPRLTGGLKMTAAETREQKLFTLVLRPAQEPRAKTTWARRIEPRGVLHDPGMCSTETDTSNQLKTTGTCCDWTGGPELGVGTADSQDSFHSTPGADAGKKNFNKVFGVCFFFYLQRTAAWAGCDQAPELLSQQTVETRDPGPETRPDHL